MKLVFSTLLALAISTMLVMSTDAAVSCGTVNQKAIQCAQFATGKASTPSSACCSGLRQLVGVAKTVKDRQDTCNCLKSTGKSIGAQDRYVSKLPSLCKINLGYPISTTTDCSRIR